jgi:PAS domain S-box-containing protein
MALRFGTKTYLTLTLGLLFVVLSVVVVVLVNSTMKKLALFDADHAARMLLDHNLAIHTYFTKVLKPKLFEQLGPTTSKDYFEPAWMSSTYAIRQIDKYFQHFSESRYYYKESAVNARSPENEADAYENNFLADLQKNPQLTTKSAIRVLDGKPYFTILRRGEAMEETCLRCHSEPEKAPGDMVKRYGPERSFHRKLDEVVQAISIRIPLSEAFSSSTRFTYLLSSLLLAALGGGFLLVWTGNKRLVIDPISRIREHAVRIATKPEFLGETIQEPKARELLDLVAAFNKMSVQLKSTYDQQEQRIADRTIELSALNEQLTQEIKERIKVEQALRESEQQYRLLFEQATDAVVVHEVESMRFVDANPAAEALWGYAKNELMSMTPVDLSLEPEKTMLALEKAAEPGGTHVPIRWQRKKDGASIAVEISASLPFTFRNRNLVCSIVRDITDREKMESMLAARIRQQAAVAELGQNALSGRDLITLMNEAVSLISQALQVEYSKVLELLSSGDELLLRSGVGWSEGLVGHAIVSAGLDSQAGYTLATDEPVIVENLRTDPRFTGPPLLIEHGVISGLSVIIRGKDRSFGVLGAHTKLSRKFTEHDVNFLKAVANILAQAIERKRVNESLAEAEELFRTAFENASIGLCMVDTEGKFLKANDQICKIWGYPRADLENMAVRDVTHPDDLDITPRFMETALSGQTDRGEFEKRYIHKNGTVVLGKVSISLVRNREGNPLYFVSHVQDITQSRNAEIERERLVSAIEQAAEAVIITDAESRILYVNPAFEKITGFEREESIGKNPSILKSGEHDSSFYADMWHTIKAGKTWSGRFTNRKKDGRLYYEEATISPVKDATGKIVNFVAVKRDITEHLEMSKQLLQAQKMEAIGTLAGGVAHDFNNILQVALGYSELLLTGKTKKDPGYDDLNKINQAARSGADLVRNLLAFSRKSEPKPVPVDLNHQVTHIEKLLQRTIPKMIQIRLDLADGLARTNADPTQIEQILMNLAVNARDAMGESGNLTIRTEQVTLDEEYCKFNVEPKPGDYVQLSVSDTGHGMDKETLEHIFEPFYTTKELGRGTGLGLSMVYGIVKQHGGHIDCYSEVGKGTTFKLYFPAISPVDEPSVEETGMMPAFGTETVLLVDDEDFVRDLGERILKKNGYTILTAANGKEALEIYQREKDRIHLVILDLIMPNMGGKDCLKRILDINPQARVLIASGYAADTSTKECVDLGAKGFVAKPYRFKELLQHVRKSLDEG